MLRTILMFLGLLVAFLPYLGFPYEWNRFVWTTTGLLIFFLVFFSRRGRRVRELKRDDEEMRSLHVMRREVEDRPEVHIEKEIIIDSVPQNDNGESQAIIEKRIAVKRKRKKETSELIGVTLSEEVVHE